MTHEQDWIDFVLEQAELAKKEDVFDPVAERFVYVHFTSESKGGGRKRRAPVYVEFAVDRETRRAHPLKDIPTDGLDVIAEALLGSTIPADTNIWEEFLKRLRAQDGSY